MALSGPRAGLRPALGEAGDREVHGEVPGVGRHRVHGDVRLRAVEPLVRHGRVLDEHPRDVHERRLRAGVRRAKAHLSEHGERASVSRKNTLKY